MSKTVALNWASGKNRTAAFTLIELLVVIGIIAILAALILSAGSGVMTRAKRARAASEIQAMSTALESYKTDNGIYPAASFLTGPPSPGVYTAKDPASADKTTYQNSSQVLYQALASQINFSDTTLSTASPATGKAYMSFKRNQVGNASAGSYVQDPWNNSYGYSTGDANVPPAVQTKYPNNGSGFFDLWSTGGTNGSKTTDTNAWLSNWQ